MTTTCCICWLRALSLQFCRYCDTWAWHPGRPLCSMASYVTTAMCFFLKLVFSHCSFDVTSATHGRALRIVDADIHGLYLSPDSEVLYRQCRRHCQIYVGLSRPGGMLVAHDLVAGRIQGPDPRGECHIHSHTHALLRGHIFSLTETGLAGKQHLPDLWSMCDAITHFFCLFHTYSFSIRCCWKK